MGRSATYILLLAALLAGCAPRHGSGTTQAEEVQADTPRRAKLLFAGDVMCHTPQIEAARRSNGDFDFTPTFEHVKPLFAAADITIVNLETVISPDGRFSGYPRFSSPAQLAAALGDAGADIAVTANNHCCDRGAAGIKATAACLDSLGIRRTGAFADDEDYLKNRILRFSAGGIEFALLNYTYGTNGIPVPDGCRVNLIDTLVMARDLREAADAEVRIVFMHWGEEYRRTCTAEQLALRDFLQARGAQIVIGSHPHVLQPAEAGDSQIFVPSLGNFVSNQRKRFSNGGLIAEVEVEMLSDGACRFDLSAIPVWVKLPQYRILPPQAAYATPMTDAERAEYEQFMADTEQALSGIAIVY